jgi:glutamate synthase (NADPH/NADH) small chain
MLKPLDDRKKRQKIPRQLMPEQPPLERIANFYEVPYGYTEELAVNEAVRCLQCKDPQCVQGCPVNVNIPWFVRLISEGKFIEAAWKLKEANLLPSICGRVCRQEDQCEKRCLLGKKGQPVSIGALERFAADYEREKGEVAIPEIPAWSGKKVAVVGSGPAGLTAAGDLVKKGHRVTIFEALHVPGGVLMYGIPEFRLPKRIVAAEIDYLRRMGVEFVFNAVIGKLFTIDDLFAEGYDAVFVGTGAGLPIFMNIQGENLVGVYSSNEYLTRVNLMRAYQFPEYDTPVLRGRKVVVVGGGNTALDASRTARRLCHEDVTVVYRRSRDDMPARKEEIQHAEEEGVKFLFLTSPARYIGDREGRLIKAELVKMELSEPDESGRRRPMVVAGSEFQIDADILIVAVGNLINPLIPQSSPDIEVSRCGNIIVDPATEKTSKKGVFAGGDIVRGGATVILAMGDGRRAANNIHEYLTNSNW